MIVALEHFQKTCSDELEILWTAVFLAFGCVSAQLQGGHGTCAFAEALPKGPSRAGHKILAAHRYIFSVNAQKNEGRTVKGGVHPVFKIAELARK